MTIEGSENTYSCRGSPATLNTAHNNAATHSRTPSYGDAGAAAGCSVGKDGCSATTDGRQRRLIPQSNSSMSLDTNLDSWENELETEDRLPEEAYDEDEDAMTRSSTMRDSDGDDGYHGCCGYGGSNGEEDGEACIPYDYESEMEECSQYTFSAGPYSPSTSAALAAAAAATATATSPPVAAAYAASPTRPDTPREATVAALPQAPQSPQWCERQRRDNQSFHSGKHFVWQQSMRHAAASSPDQMRYALRSIVREARCRELQALRSQPAVSFVRMDAPAAGERCTRASMRSSCMLASATSTAQRKARYIQVISEHWRALEARVEEMLGETETESVAASESHLRSIAYALNALSLFSSDPAKIIRELNMAHVEEQRRQRHDREAQLLASLEEQGRLFLLPTLYAEEYEEPVPVIRIEAEAPRPVVANNEVTHPWQLLSPNASVYSLAPSSNPESVGELSPALSCCTYPSEACTPTWRSPSRPDTQHLPSSLSFLPLADHAPQQQQQHLGYHQSTAWRDMQPPRLPLLDLFMTAPAVVPSTVIADSEAGVPYVMPVDPSYTQRELHRCGAIARCTIDDALSSPPMSSARARPVLGLAGLQLGSSGGAVTVGGGRGLQPSALEASDDSWGSFAEGDEEEVTEFVETIKLTVADLSGFHFDLRETLMGGGGGGAGVTATGTAAAGAATANSGTGAAAGANWISLTDG